MSRRPSLPLAVVALLALLALADRLRAEPTDEPPAVDAALERALANPPATGLLLTVVVPGTQAETAGLEPGDVLTAYGGTAVATVAALQGAMAAATEGPVVVKVVRAGAPAREVRVQPGRLGVQLVPVEAGKPVGPLPPTTPSLAFGVSSLATTPRDDWYVFEMDGRHVGYEHGSSRVEDGRIVLRREVAFDGGETWGLNHFDVTLEATADPVPRFLSYRFENPLHGYVAEGRRVPAEGEEGERFAFTASVPDQESEASGFALPTDLPVVPSYLVEVLAGMMPRAAGTCFAFRLLSDGDGRLGLPNALLVVGEEEVALADGTKVQAWKIEQRALGGGTTNRYWVETSGRVVAGDYGGAMTRLATKEKALEGVDARLAPRSAD